VTGQPNADVVDTTSWWTTTRFEEFVGICCGHRHISLLSDPKSFSVTQRVATVNPITVCEFAVDSEVWLDCGGTCRAYHVLLLQSGRTECLLRGLTLSAAPGSSTVYVPNAVGQARWAAGTKMILCKIDQRAVDDALTDALGVHVIPQIDFAPVMPVTAAPTRSWISMLHLFKQQLFRPDTVLNQPLVAMPFVDSLVRGLLLAAEHSHRDVLIGEQPLIAPRAVRAAVEIMHEEADLPLTLSSIAARSHASVRSLQQGFRRHLGTSPMAYLREVRLTRAHQELLDSDPSSATVASIAYNWGFTNLGRFAAAHNARYRETPAKTLRRSASRRTA
jgi:AraC-like DNA-binding protein